MKLGDLGLHAQWDGDDRDFVQAGNAKHWRRWKRENGWVGPVAMTDIPGFVDSVQELYDYGYSLTDIGAFFGVTRERVRQWFRDLPGLERLPDDFGSMFREWDDEAMCFLPLTHDEVLERARARAANERVRAREDRHARRRASHVRKLKALAATLDRTPATKDFIEHTGDSVSGISLYWGKRDGLSYSECMDALWTAAGMERPPQGYHVTVLTDEQLWELYHRAVAGEDVGALAEEYGVVDSTAYAIRQGTYPRIATAA